MVMRKKKSEKENHFLAYHGSINSVPSETSVVHDLQVDTLQQGRQ